MKPIAARLIQNLGIIEVISALYFEPRLYSKHMLLDDMEFKNNFNRLKTIRMNADELVTFAKNALTDLEVELMPITQETSKEELPYEKAVQIMFGKIMAHHSVNIVVKTTIITFC